MVFWLFKSFPIIHVSCLKMPLWAIHTEWTVSLLWHSSACVPVSIHSKPVRGKIAFIRQCKLRLLWLEVYSIVAAYSSFQQLVNFVCGY